MSPFRVGVVVYVIQWPPVCPLSRRILFNSDSSNAFR